MPPLSLMVSTEDRELLEKFKAMKDDGLRISSYTTDAAPSPTPEVQELVSFVLNVSSAVAAGLILEVIKKYFSKKSIKKTTINAIDIGNNSSQIFITINNYIQQQEIAEIKGERDKNEFEVIDSE